MTTLHEDNAGHLYIATNTAVYATAFNPESNGCAIEDMTAAENGDFESSLWWDRETGEVHAEDYRDTVLALPDLEEMVDPARPDGTIPCVATLDGGKFTADLAHCGSAAKEYLGSAI